MHGTPARVRQIFERISDAMAQTEVDVRSYIKHHREFADIGERMLKEWANGRQLSFHPA
jgi:serine/threonine-protein kinase HipA